MTSSTLSVFDKYQVVRRIAVGGMGEVFLAKQTGLPGFERQVILKSLIAAEGEPPPQMVSRFLDEARVAASLNHPNVVSVFEAGVWHGTFFIAMEYIPGWNLSQLARDLVVAETALPPPLGAGEVADTGLLPLPGEAQAGGQLARAHLAVTEHDAVPDRFDRLDDPVCRELVQLAHLLGEVGQGDRLADLATTARE